jgi:N-acetylglucosamine-6-phosphate deacetylase
VDNDFTHTQQPQGRFALANGRVALPQQVVDGQAVVIEGDKILGITNASALPADVRQIDVGGRLVCPGLIDIHTHGALNHSFNEASEDAFATVTQENMRHGVTSLLAALATSLLPELEEILDFGRRWMQAPRPGAQVLGMYLEGPYISRLQAGALDPRYIRTPDDGTASFLLAYRDVLRIVTLAPELPGALALVDALHEAGIIPSVGHSAAKDDQVWAAMQRGLRHVTHIWSGQSMMVREGPWRKPGVVESALVFEGLMVEMISDNRHLPSTLMKLAYKCVGPDRLCAISDATPGAGLPQGTRFRLGEMEYEVDDGVGVMLDRSAFAGSTTLLNQMVPVLTEVVGVPLPAAIRMVTLTPARAIGWQERKGSLAAGKDADIAIFEDDFRVWRTMIGGQWVFEAGAL